MENQEYSGLEIAIIGMSLRFPGADTPAGFWSDIAGGKESVKFFSEEELKDKGVDQSLLDDPSFVRSPGALIKDKEYFDAAFFGYTPAEAIIMDPQIRIFHEIVWNALEDSGYNTETYPGSIGLYAGASSSFVWEAMVELSGKGAELGRFDVMQSSSRDFLTTKISYKFNLKGPSYLVQTACSTSLVAIHTACRALLLGECNIAVAGGVSVLPVDSPGYHYKEGMILSRDGHCRTFDHKATGTVNGDGAAAVVLKPLQKALKDGDHIYAVIKGSAINNDGNRKVGYTAPSVNGQAEVITAALNFAKVKGDSISYIECHGTATDLGDPIEMEALRKGIASDKKDYCAVGSVKANIGHLDAAAGVAGLIKVALALQHKQIPPAINYEAPNPAINFTDSPFYVNTELKSWSSENTPRRAAVSSFGIGGTNAHLILEEAPAKLPVSSSKKHHLLLLSAKNAVSLDNMTSGLKEYLSGQRETILPDVAYTLMTGRAHFDYRRYILGDNTITYRCKDTDRPVVFLFPGGGVQHVNMAAELYR